MRLTHPDYTKLVFEAYNKKLANNELSFLLVQSTPANIRRECANVYQERYEKKDEPILRAFFGPAEHGRKFVTVIQDFDVNRFRPLDSYLKGAGKKSINDRNLELFAWLIDFQHRPFIFGKDVVLTAEELSLLGLSTNNLGKTETESAAQDEALEKKGEESEELLKEELDEESVRNKMSDSSPFNVISKNKTAKNKSKRAAIIFLILIICTGGIYAIWQQKQDTVCVYWAGDHYEKVPCNADSKGRLIIPMNQEKVKSFRKITMEDTITERSIGKVYYIKDSNIIKFYTEGGNYPEGPNRTLKKLSRYIYENHLRKKEVFSKDSSAE